MYHNRLPFFEVLSFSADFPISERLFSVSEPSAIDGVETKVTITPKDTSFFGPKVIQYRRFDLTDIPRISLKRNGAKTYSDLARNLALYPLFKYRLFDRRYPNQIAIRYLRIQPLDVQDELLPNITVAGQNFDLSAASTSDCFVGKLRLALI